MESKDGLIINVELNGRWLALLGIIALLSVLAYSLAFAQEGEPPSINSAPEAPGAGEPQPTPITVPESSQAQEGDLVYTANGGWVPRDSAGVASSSSSDDVAAVSATGGGRHFYLSTANYNPTQAPTACALGYHLASLWELYDVSNLTYDYDHPAAYVKVDSGYGPPSNWYGWVRTGYDSSGDSTTGTGNCLNWSSNSNSYYGVSVRLSRTWETAPGDIGPWDATSFTCNTVGPVWCVGD